MEKYTHTFRFGSSASLREHRMARMSPSVHETHAEGLLDEARREAESGADAALTRIDAIQTRLSTYIGTVPVAEQPAVNARLTSMIALRARVATERTELTAIRERINRDVTDQTTARPAVAADRDNPANAWAIAVEGKTNAYYADISTLIGLAVADRPANFRVRLQEYFTGISRLRALAPANPRLNMSTLAAPPAGARAAGWPVGGDAPRTAAEALGDQEKIINGDPTAPDNSPQKLGLVRVVTEFLAKKNSTAPGDVVRTAVLRNYLENTVRDQIAPRLLDDVKDIADGLNPGGFHQQAERVATTMFQSSSLVQSELNRAFAVVAPSTTPSTTPSTGPTSTPEGAFNALPTGMRPFAEQLRNGIVAGTDTGPAIAGLNAQLASIGDGARPGIVELLNTYLRNTPKMVRLTGAVLSVVDRTATSTGAPGTYPPAGPGVMGALPPLPPGMEQPANAFFNQARPLLGLLQSIGFLPPSFTVALNAMNGREVATLQTELTARNQQLAERRARLGTLAPGSAERTQVEGEIRALEFRVQQLTQQIATLRTATTTGSPEMQALMRQLMTQFLRMQRQGGQMGMMPMMRPGGGGFDLYGMNQLGNSAMGYGYGRVGPMGGAIGYYPQGYGPNVFTGPVSVMGGAPMMGPPMMGPPMMGPMMGPGPMPFPPRPPMMGGGMVMGGGFFTAPKPSGNDSRPV